jgi:hypothetical protein
MKYKYGALVVLQDPMTLNMRVIHNFCAVKITLKGMLIVTVCTVKQHLKSLVKSLQKSFI